MDQEIYGGAIRVCGGALEAVTADGAVLWRWCPPRLRIVGVLAVGEGGDAITLAEPIESLPRSEPTLFRCGSDGRLVWTAEVPPGGDGTYVAATMSAGEVAASTWDGRKVTIDADTGRIKRETFAK
jgi:hypothetical protein